MSINVGLDSLIFISQKSKIITVLFLFLSIYAVAQQKPDSCNRDVKLKEDKKYLIKEVCIPMGYKIFYIETALKDIDINADKRPDFICYWSKKNKREGDTVFISAYSMNPDSTFSFLKTFKNLMPIELNSYDTASANPYYADLYYDCYHQTCPLRNLTFKDGNIELIILTEAVAGLEISYQYEAIKKTWILKSIKEFVDIPNKGRRYEPYPMPEKEETIDDFSYEKYLCPEGLNK